MTASLTSPVIYRPAFPEPSEASTPTNSNPSTPASSPPESPNNNCPTTAVVPRPSVQPPYFRANSYPQNNPLPKSRTNRLRSQSTTWQRTPSTTIQLPPWYTTERAHIQPLRLRIPLSNYTTENQAFHHQQGKTKPSGALCLMFNASPYPRA